MGFVIGVKQILGEEWGPLGPRAVGAGYWRPTINVAEMSYEWVGPTAYGSVEEALSHLVTDAEGDKLFAFPLSLDNEMVALTGMVDRWQQERRGAVSRHEQAVAAIPERARLRERDKGLMVAELSVHCAYCSRWGRLEERMRSDAVNEAKRKGWRYTECHGWVCEHHKEETS